MSDFLNRMKSAAKADLKTIVLPEGEDPRTIVAATKIIEEGLAKLVILGNPDEINVPGATVIDPRNAEKHEEYAQKFAELRAKKAALQKALADAIEACTGTKVDPASLTLTDEDVSFPKENISPNIKVTALTDADRQELEGYLKKYCKYFGVSMDEIMKKPFKKLAPATSRPYANLYTPN